MNASPDTCWVGGPAVRLTGCTEGLTNRVAHLVQWLVHRLDDREMVLRCQAVEQIVDYTGWSKSLCAPDDYTILFINISVVLFLFNNVIYVFLLYDCMFMYEIPWLKFFLAFSLVVKQMPWWKPQRRGTARTLPSCCCSMYFCVVLCIVCFVTFPVFFVCICVLYYCHRVATQLQLNISYQYNRHVHRDFLITLYFASCSALTSTVVLSSGHRAGIASGACSSVGKQNSCVFWIIMVYYVERRRQQFPWLRWNFVSELCRSRFNTDVYIWALRSG
jgi:hypothetical protein